MEHVLADRKGQHPSDYLKTISDFEATDFIYSVCVSNIDGSFFFLPSCYIEEDSEFYFVIEEHHGRFFFEKELINDWKCWI